LKPAAVMACRWFSTVCPAVETRKYEMMLMVVIVVVVAIGYIYYFASNPIYLQHNTQRFNFA